MLLAPNAYKESLSALEAARAMARGLATLPVEPVLCPLSDGGDGFLEALVMAGAALETVEVSDAIGRPVSATYARTGDTVIAELVSAAGLAQIPVDRRDPLLTTTYGVGEILARAWDRGPFRRAILGLGGSATVDGGVGLLQALGIRFLDDEDREVGRGGGGLATISRIDRSAASPVLDAEIVLAVDVTNPLLGPRGAARVYGPQKGATPESVEALEAGLARLARVLARETGRQVADLPGAGATGGVPAGLVAIADARLTPGFLMVAEAIGLEARVARAGLVLTGEGRLDDQTFDGKVIGRLAELCETHRVPLVAIAGGLTADGIAALNRRGGWAFSLVDGPMPLSDAQADAGSLLARAAGQTVGLFLSGRAART